MEVNKIHNELNEKVSEIKHLQLELTKRENGAGEAVDSLKRLIKTLEKENTALKVCIYALPYLTHYRLLLFFCSKTDNGNLYYLPSETLILSYSPCY